MRMMNDRSIDRFERVRERERRMKRQTETETEKRGKQGDGEGLGYSPYFTASNQSERDCTTHHKFIVIVRSTSTSSSSLRCWVTARAFPSFTFLWVAEFYFQKGD